MTTVYYDHDHASNNLQRPLIAYSKGAVERILPFCSSYRSPPGTSADHATSTISPMTAEFESEIVSRMEELASQGLRVLAFASKHLDRDDGKDGKWRQDEVERGFTFLGIAGLYDPPRLESKEAIRTCMDAGIVVRMLTGDHSSVSSIPALPYFCSVRRSSAKTSCLHSLDCEGDRQRSRADHQQLSRHRGLHGFRVRQALG